MDKLAPTSMQRSITQEIVIFSASTILLTSVLCFLSYQYENQGIAFLSVFTPTIMASALTLAKSGTKGLKALFVQQTLRKTPLQWYVLSVFGIPLVAFLAILTYLDFELSGVGLRTTQLLPQLVVIIFISLGEEYGWRAYVMPRLLKKFNVFYASVALGLIWGVWHYPAYLIGTGVPEGMDFMIFLLWVVLASLFMGWIYYSTRSVLTAILIHSSANAAFNYLFLLPEFTGTMEPFWYLLLYLFVFLMLVFYVGRKKLLVHSKETT